MLTAKNRSRSHSQKAQADPRRILVLRSGVDPLDYYRTVCAKQGAILVRELPLINAISCRMPSEVAFTSLEAQPEIERIDLDLYLTIASPLGWWQGRSGQIVPWGITRIAAPDAWDRTTGEGIRVGIIDTGIDRSHPDVGANVAAAVNVTRPNGSAADENGHGTHVAGTIAALDNNFGVIGAAPKAKLYIAKAFDGDGSGRLSDVIAGLHWCILNRCQVINFSFGSGEGNDSLRDAVRSAARHCIMVAAAGNNGRADSVDVPARYPEVIAVAASDRANRIADFSSRGPQVTLAAPGVDVLSTVPGNRYASLSGTSMASPHVAAAVALLLKADPRLSRSELVQLLKDGAQPVNGSEPGAAGAGVLNVAKSLRQLERGN